MSMKPLSLSSRLGGYQAMGLKLSSLVGVMLVPGLNAYLVTHVLVQGRLPSFLPSNTNTTKYYQL